MSNEILMPALSPTMEEGTLAKWLISEGDTISSGDLIAEIETDKATMEVESIFDGTVGKLFFNEGSEGIKVNTPIGIILDPGEKYDEKVHGPNVKSGSNENNDKELIKRDGGNKPLDQVVKIEQVDEQKSNTSDSVIAVNINGTDEALNVNGVTFLSSGGINFSSGGAPPVQGRTLAF